MDRRDYYYKQLVMDTELDAGFDGAERADRAMMADMGMAGITTGGSVVQSSPASMSVTLGGPTVAYDSAGRRVATATNITFSLATSLTGISTAASTSGKERWVSAFLRFTRAQSDPRSDGNNSPVNFIQAEACEVVVRMGVEANTGTSVKPTLVEGEILICDVLLTYGKSSVVNADINTSRVTPFRRAKLEDVDASHLIATPGDFGGPLAALAAGVTTPSQKYTLLQLLEGLSAMLGANVSQGTDGVSYIGAAPPVGFANISLGGVTCARDYLNALASIVNAHLATSGTVHNAARIARSSYSWLGSTEVFSALNEIVDDLGSQVASSSGARNIGVEALAINDVNIGAGSVYNALLSLATQMNIAYAFPIDILRFVPDNTPNDWAAPGTYGTYLQQAIANTNNKLIHIPIRVPNGKTIQRVDVHVYNSGHTSLPSAGSRIVASLGSRVIDQPNWGMNSFVDGGPAGLATYDNADGYIISCPGPINQSVNNLISLNIQGEQSASNGTYNMILGATAYIF